MSGLQMFVVSASNCIYFNFGYLSTDDRLKGNDTWLTFINGQFKKCLFTNSVPYVGGINFCPSVCKCPQIQHVVVNFVIDATDLVYLRCRSRTVTICHEMYNFETKLQKYLTKEILSISGMVPSEWNSVYIFKVTNQHAEHLSQKHATGLKERVRKATGYSIRTLRFHCVRPSTKIK